MPITATAQQIIDDAAAELGIAPGTVGVLGSGTTAGQALVFLNSIGYDMLAVHDWQFLMKTAEFTGDGVADSFAMPSDFGRIVNQTAWALNERRPMQGPLSPQMWGWTQFGIVSVGVFFRYRLLDNELAVFPVPGSGEVFKFFYISKNWVLDGTTGLPKGSLESGSDIPMFDRRLMTSALKLRLWAQKGFETTVLQGEFDYNLETQMSQNQGSEIIRLSGPTDTFYINPFINIPDGSWEV